MPYSWFGQLKNILIISVSYWGRNLDSWQKNPLVEKNFNFNVKLDSMKWKKVSQWKARKEGKAGKDSARACPAPAGLR